MNNCTRVCFLLLVVLLFTSAQRLYKPGDQLLVHALRLGTPKNLPLDYFSLKFCKPEQAEEHPMKFGQFVRGDRVQDTVYKIPFMQDIKCSRVDAKNCPVISPRDVEDFKAIIRSDYRAFFQIDDVPIFNIQTPQACGTFPGFFFYFALPMFFHRLYESQLSDPSFPIGCPSAPTVGQKYTLLNNHLNFKIYYHEVSNGDFTITKAEIYPSSILHTNSSCLAPSFDFPKNLNAMLDMESDDFLQKLVFSYSVVWQRTFVDTRGAQRWQNYIVKDEQEGKTRIRWFGVINSGIMLVFLVGLVLVMILNVLRPYIVGFLELDPSRLGLGENEWKKHVNSVFQIPAFPSALASLAGAGVQVLIGAVSMLAIGYTDNYGGDLLTIVNIAFPISGFAGGFTSGVLYKMYNGKNYRSVALMSLSLLPCAYWALFIVNDLLLRAFSNSSAIIPFSEIMLYMLPWIVLHVPLSFLGSLIAYKRKRIEPIFKPTVEATESYDQMDEATEDLEVLTTESDASSVPAKPKFVTLRNIVLLAGTSILAFSVIFIETYFGLSSVVLYQSDTVVESQGFSYTYGLMCMIMYIMTCICCGIAIAFTQLQYHAHPRYEWLSFLSVALVPLMFLTYALVFLITKTMIQSALLIVVFIIYFVAVAGALFLVGGSASFVSALLFVRFMFWSLKNYNEMSLEKLRQQAKPRSPQEELQEVHARGTEMLNANEVNESLSPPTSPQHADDKPEAQST